MQISCGEPCRVDKPTIIVTTWPEFKNTTYRMIVFGT